MKNKMKNSVISLNYHQAIRECVEHTIYMFSSSPYDYVRDEEEDENETIETLKEKIKDTALRFQELSNELNIDFWYCIDSWNSGSKIIRELLKKSE